MQNLDWHWSTLYLLLCGYSAHFLWGQVTDDLGAGGGLLSVYNKDRKCVNAVYTAGSVGNTIYTVKQLARVQL